MPWSPGTLVRLVNDPSRQGVLTGKTKQLGGVPHWQIVFADGPSYYPEDQFEPANVSLDPLELLAEGRLSPWTSMRLAITHARLSGKLADVIYSMETTGTDFYEYQFKPVLRLLNSANQGLLIADEVG